jgi:type VI secretion system protein ImpH
VARQGKLVQFRESVGWDPALAADGYQPVRLGQAGQHGYTSGMAPNWSRADLTMRRDARFHPAERMQHKRRRTAAMAMKEG